MQKNIFRSGETIIREGFVSGFLYYIVKGSVKIERNDGSFFLSDGDFFGEEGVFTEKMAEYTATAVVETVTESYIESELDSFIDSHRDSALRIFTKAVALASSSCDVAKNRNFHMRFLESLENLCFGTGAGMDGVTSIVSLATETGIKISEIKRIIENMDNEIIMFDGTMVKVLDREGVRHLISLYSVEMYTELLPGKQKGLGTSGIPSWWL